MAIDTIEIAEREATEVRFSGFGGQGVILAGLIAGKAASIFENRHATLTRSFGPESRGGACSATVVIADRRVDYPFLRNMEILITMSQAAYLKFIDDLRPGGILIYEEDLVSLERPREDIQLYAIPATRFAEELGRRIVLNIVMFGFFTAATKVIGVEAARKAVLDSVPAGTEELNLSAFDKGYEYGLNLNKGGESDG
jgi:2-oxoglutarate ferredoxin oxidoreductase subunit gamma